MTQELDLGIELSFVTLKYPVFRGNYPPFIQNIDRELPLQPCSFLSHSIHSLSHFDLPWCIEDQIEEIRSYDSKFKPLPELDKIDEVISAYSKIRVFDTVIVDITKKLKFLRRYIDTGTEFLKSDTTAESFEELMKVLEITKDDIKLPKDKLKEKLIIFRTGYDALSHRAANYSNSYFELRHPYLIAPYLEYDSNENSLLNELVDELGIIGIGSDTYGLENPLYFASRHNLPEYAKYYYNENKYKKPPFRPVLAKLMTETKYYIKNLRNINRIETKKGYAFGKSCIVPMAFGNKDGNVIRIFFKAEEK